LESDGAIKKAFVMTGTGGSVNNKDAEDVSNPRGFNLRDRMGTSLIFQVRGNLGI
jgi:hypothetical protein